MFLSFENISLFWSLLRSRVLTARSFSWFAFCRRRRCCCCCRVMLGSLCVSKQPAVLLSVPVSQNLAN